MVLKVYSIYDSKTKIFNVPFFNHTHGEAERNFSSLVTEKESKVARHPEDYDLFYLGDYDDQTGHMEPLNTPQHIAKALQYKTQ